jgi:hypothetical protein
MLTYGEAHKKRLTVKEIKENLKLDIVKRIDGNTFRYQKKNGDWAIRLWDTEIITEQPDNRTILTTGGFNTVLTRDRLNKFLKRFKGQSGGFNGVRTCKRILYYVAPDGSESIFYDGMVIEANGYPIKPLKVISKATIRMQKQLKAYIDGLDKWLDKYYTDKKWDINKADADRQGDCWSCLFVDGTGKPAMGTGHLQGHLKEKYYMWSLIVNALKEKGYVDPLFIISIGSRDSIKRAVRTYFQKALNI